MKYLTKEWYELCQRCSYHLLIKISEKAAVFSEEYYQQIYHRKLRAFLKREMKDSGDPRLLTLAMIETADPEPELRSWLREEGFLNEEEHKGSPNGMKAEMEAERSPKPFKPFDEKRESKLFQICIHERHISELQNALPPEILREVADIRVLALDVATKDVKKAIRSWCRKNAKEADRIAGQYHWIEELHNGFSFHDNNLVKIDQKGNKLVIEFEQVHNQSESIIFHDFRILEQEGDLTGAWWLYEEVYPAENGNEYHVLLQRKDGQLAYLTILARKIELKSYDVDTNQPDGC